MHQPNNRGCVHAKAEAALGMVRAGDFDALQEYAWSKEGVEYHEWVQDNNHFFQTCKGNK